MDWFIFECMKPWLAFVKKVVPLSECVCVCVCARLQTARVVRCGPWTDGRWCHFFLFALSWLAGEARAAICNAHLPDHTHTRLMTHCHSMTTTPAAYKHSCHKCKSPSQFHSENVFQQYSVWHASQWRYAFTVVKIDTKEVKGVKESGTPLHHDSIC